MVHSPPRYDFSNENPIDALTEVKLSPIHGYGLFAKCFIPKGTIWWRPKPGDILAFTETQFYRLISSEQSITMKNFIKAVLNYAYFEVSLNSLVLGLDNSRYVNHSLNPSSGFGSALDPIRSVALCDIEMGVEITENYFEYGIAAWLGEYQDYFIPTSWKYQISK